MQTMAPTELDTVLSPEFLSQALGQAYPGVQVESLRIVETQVTVATKIRFAVTYRGDVPPEIPRAFCVKGFFGESGAAFLGSGASETEVNFYRQMAPSMPLRLPRAVYAEIDPATRHGLLLMEDMVPAGTRFLTALEPYSPAQAEASLDQLACLHAQTWNSKNLETQSWLRPQLPRFAGQPRIMPEAMIDSLLDGARGEGLTPEIKRAARIYQGLQALSELDAAKHPCVLHGDAHAGNVFETPQGTGLIDWQITQIGPWSLDAAYHIAAVLTGPERERSERRLLQHYLQRLAAYGAEPPEWEDAWKLYRQSLVYGFFLWSITRRVAEEITLQFVQRLGNAVMAHRSFELLGV
jgi:hypothetical protein